MKILNTLFARAGLAALLFVVLAASLSTVRGAGANDQDGALLPVDPIAGQRVPGYVLAQIPDLDAASLGSYRAERIFGDWYKLYPGGMVAAESVDIDSLLAAAETLPGVAVVAPDYYVSLDPTSVDVATNFAPGFAPDATPNDPLYYLQWHMHQVQVEQAWETNQGLNADTHQGVNLAVIDSGISSSGEDGFCNGISAEFNAITNTTGPGSATDDNGHGTHVAGTAAGCANNGIGVVGVAPAARLIAVKVLAANGIGTIADVAKGFVWALGLQVENYPVNPYPAQVINLSFSQSCGATYPDCTFPIMDSAISFAAFLDVVIVATSGNLNLSYVNRPGNNPQVIAVGATRFD